MSSNFFKISKGLGLNPQSTTPSNPTNGDIYYDTVLNKFRKYENSAWSDLGSGGGSAPSVFDTTYTSDPSGTITHNLGALPTAFAILYNENADGHYVPLNPESYIKADAASLYVTTSSLTIDGTHQLRIIAASGASVVVSGGGGSGGINYISNPNAETDLTGWVTYADAAQATPVNGTGGTANITLTRNTTTPLRGLADFKITKDAADRQGEGISYDFTIDSADKSKRLSISFDMAASSAYVLADMGVYIYDVTNSILITPSSVNLPATPNGKVQVYFNATTSVNYRLILHVASTNASAYTANFVNVSVGPQEVVQTTPISEWKSFTPTGTFTTNSTYTGKWRRVGDTAEIQYQIAFSGAPNSDSCILNLPSGMTIDTTKIESSAANLGGFNGTGTYLKSGVATFLLSSRYVDATRFWVMYQEKLSASNPVNELNVTQSAPSVIASGDYLTFNISVPIAQWAGSSVSLTNSRVEFASNSNTTNTTTDNTSFDYGINGNIMPNGAAGTTYIRRVRFQTPIQPTDRILLETNYPAGWVPSQFSTFRINGTSYGMGHNIVNSTDVDVYFYSGGFEGGATYAANGTAFDVLYGLGFKWRLVKSSNPLSIGNGAVLATAMTNEEATALGLKQYLSSGSYNGGAAPTITGPAGLSVNRGIFIPYQMQDGTWRLKINIDISYSSASIVQPLISGVTFKNGIYQALAGMDIGSATNCLTSRADTNASSLTFGFSGNTTQLIASGDVELDSKPTWAY